MMETKLLYTPSDINNYQDIIEYLEDFNPDCNSNTTIYSSIVQNELKNLLCIGKQFMYFACPSKPEFDFIYITKSVKNVLGYSTDELSTKRLYDFIHPADRGMIIKATLKSIDIQKQLRIEPLKFVIHMNFRIKRKDGTYIRVLRQTSNFKNDENGLMKLSIAIVSDISHLKTTDEFNFYYTGPEFPKLDFPDEELKKANNHYHLTNREKQVIGLLEKGNSSKEIANQLYISKHTVDKHRSNILEKLSLKNTAEIITYAKDYQII